MTAAVVEVLAMAAYHTDLLIAATTISYGLAIILMGMLAMAAIFLV